jgi:hypothetical protein
LTNRSFGGAGTTFDDIHTIRESANSVLVDLVATFKRDFG